MSVALIAALPRELAGLVSGLKPDPVFRRRGIFLYRRKSTVLVAAGMGANRVSLAVEAALQAVPADTLISLGLAGSCSREVKPGTLLRPRLVIDALTGERFETSEENACAVLVSTEEIASTTEKRRLHESYGASLVDMEAATVARLAVARNLSFRAVKGISDAHDLDIAHLSRFSDKHGHFRTLRFAAHTAARPDRWGAAVRLGRHSKAALMLLSEYLVPLIER